MAAVSHPQKMRPGIGHSAESRSLYHAWHISPLQLKESASTCVEIARNTRIFDDLPPNSLLEDFRYVRVAVSLGRFWVVVWALPVFFRILVRYTGLPQTASNMNVDQVLEVTLVLDAILLVTLKHTDSSRNFDME